MNTMKQEAARVVDTLDKVLSRSPSPQKACGSIAAGVCQSMLIATLDEDLPTTRAVNTLVNANFLMLHLITTIESAIKTLPEDQQSALLEAMRSANLDDGLHLINHIEKLAP